MQDAEGDATLAPVKTHEVTIRDIPSVVKEMSANNNRGFDLEYKYLESGREFSRNVAQQFQNKLKNRHVLFSDDNVHVPSLHRAPPSLSSSSQTMCSNLFACLH